MQTNTNNYASFLLRLWWEQRGGAMNCRASLESARTGEEHIFPDIEKLIQFLQSLVGNDQVHIDGSKN